MTNNDGPNLEPNVRSVSATFIGEQPKMSRSPERGRAASAAVRLPLKRKGRRSVTAPVQVVMTVRLGAEPSVVLRGSGITWRYPADRCIYDVVQHFNWLLDNPR